MINIIICSEYFSVPDWLKYPLISKYRPNLDDFSINRPVSERLLDHGLKSRKNGCGTTEPESLKMSDCRFETLNEVEIE